MRPCVLVRGQSPEARENKPSQGYGGLANAGPGWKPDHKGRQRNLIAQVRSRFFFLSSTWEEETERQQGTNAPAVTVGAADLPFITT